jgi:group I intron endonuclease
MKTKKELKNIYKEMKFKMGIFQIRNTVNGKIYVEGSTDLDAIWNRHKFQLKMDSHPNVELQKDWKDFGEGNFSYEILSEIKQDDTKTIDYRKEIMQLEKMFIEELQPFNNNGYNTGSGKQLTEY